MCDANAKPQGLHLGRVEDPFGHGIEYTPRADMISCQHRLEFGCNISTSLKSDAAEIRAVSDAKVVEWTKQALV